MKEISFRWAMQIFHLAMDLMLVAVLIDTLRQIQRQQRTVLLLRQRVRKAIAHVEGVFQSGCGRDFRVLRCGCHYTNRCLFNRLANQGRMIGLLGLQQNQNFGVVHAAHDKVPIRL